MTFLVPLRVLGGLDQNLCHDLTMYISQSEMPSLKLVGQPLVVDPETVQQRCLQVMDVHWIFHDVIAIVVRLTQANASLDAASS